MKRLGLIAVFLCLAVTSVHAEGARNSAPAPADSILYRLVTSAFDEARLTARIELHAYRWNHEVPLIDGTTHEGRPLDGHLQPATIYLGGLEAGAQYRAVRLFGWYRFNMGNKNVGLLPSGETGVRFKNGDAASGGLASPEFSGYGGRIEYAPTVWRNLALGGGFAYRHRGASLRPDCDPDCGSGILTESTTDLFLLHLPVRYRFAWGTLHLKAGMSLFGSHQSEYNLDIAYSNPPELGNLTKAKWEFEEASPQVWSAETGVALLAYGFMLRTSMHIKRLWLEGAYTETVGGVKLQVGLPF